MAITELNFLLETLYLCIDYERFDLPKKQYLIDRDRHRHAANKGTDIYQ